MIQQGCTNPACHVVAGYNILYHGAKYCGVARVERAAYHNSGAQHVEDP